MKRSDVIWAAGLFDGEGSISLSHRSTPVSVALGMTCEKTVRKFAKVTGARIYGPYVYPRRLPVWAAEGTGLRGCRMLTLLLPYLVTKVRKARLALRVGKTIQTQGTRLTKRMRTRRDDLIAKFYGGNNG